VFVRIVKDTPLSFYKSRPWLELRYATLRRYGWTCMSCGLSRKDGVVIHVDHIVPISSRPDLALDPENLQVACAACNLGKSNKYADDLRPVPEPAEPPPVRPRLSPPEKEKRLEILRFLMQVAEKTGATEKVNEYLREYQELMAVEKSERPKPQSVVASLLKDMP
jgi:5-methylcytosine-specific restriction endonuclease McrA